MSRRLLVVTNDFPPRPGGIQSFVHGLVSRLPADRVVVLTSRWRGDTEYDAEQPFRVVRRDTRVLLPRPGVRREAVRLFREHGCTDVWFGAAAPLGLLAPALRRAGAQRIVATTHGHEAGWASLPAARALLRRIAGDVDAVTYLGDYTRRRLAAAVGPHADRLHRLVPGVDTVRFSPGGDVTGLRARLGLVDRPTVVCVSRLMPRKGQDVLVTALPAIRERVPGAALLLVGGGPARGRLVRLAAETGVAADVVITGSVPWTDLPAHYRAGDVFAMPCRDRLRGLDVEGLGMVFLEAAGCGLPVVAGRAGGAPDAVLDGRTGSLVDGRDVAGVADVLAGLLADPERARRWGAAGRAWVEQEWTWERSVGVLTGLLGWDVSSGGR
jgi:phosphatidylinositol alpha-1,6-mannosyltransferase